MIKIRDKMMIMTITIIIDKMMIMMMIMTITMIMKKKIFNFLIMMMSIMIYFMNKTMNKPSKINFF